VTAWSAFGRAGPDQAGHCSRCASPRHHHGAASASLCMRRAGAADRSTGILTPAGWPLGLRPRRRMPVRIRRRAPRRRPFHQLQRTANDMPTWWECAAILWPFGRPNRASLRRNSRKPEYRRAPGRFLPSPATRLWLSMACRHPPSLSRKFGWL